MKLRERCDFFYAEVKFVRGLREKLGFDLKWGIGIKELGM